ncbi:MAG: hypothetical protein ACFFG0_46085 [Candidatus Thorarchaeota archaeon]
MNADDFLEGGLKLKDFKKIAGKPFEYRICHDISECWNAGSSNAGQERPCQAACYDIIKHINITSKEKEAYHRYYAKEIKGLLNRAIILVGGLKSMDLVEKLIV